MAEGRLVGVCNRGVCVQVIILKGMFVRHASSCDAFHPFGETKCC